MSKPLLLLLVACGPCGRVPEPPRVEPAAAGTDLADPDVPGAMHVSEQLQARLDEALAAKGADYEPRTHHLEDDGSPTFTNRLILETSPYLLQHAHNPVSWFPWGDEAFERARAENKPVLMSIGYSTCHWCHVMEVESFEDLEIAEYINANYIAVKVDREERPDVDDLYMTAVQALTGRGGWPMTTVLTPDREPFFAGTYFPPRDGARGARVGFLTILRDLATRYRDDRAELVEQARELSRRIREASAPQPPSSVPDAETLAATTRTLTRMYDARLGGFGRAPKFPQPSRVGFLLRARRLSGDDEPLAMAEHTLRAMAAGGMYDHAAGGFHRYSVDARWLVPHFEKMLYDNAQLASTYLEGFQATHNADFARVASEILDYVAREMRAPGGGFYSATDADSRTPEGHLEEGWFFTWTPDELAAVLDADALAMVTRYYAVTPQGNFEGRNILHTPVAHDEVARSLGVGSSQLRARIDAARESLRLVRERRPAPLRDDKILAAWNGLMIGAFARGALVLDEPHYAEIAAGGAEHVLGRMRDEQGRLMRSWLGRPRHRAVLQDYAFLIEGLLDLHEATGDARWVREALALQAEQDAHFADENGGYFLTADDAEALLVRDKPASDGAIPSGNSVSASNLLRLSELMLDDAYRERAERLFAAFGEGMRRFGIGMTRMLTALDRYLDRSREIVLVSASAEAEAPMLEVVRGMFLPNRVLVRVRGGGALEGDDALPIAAGKRLLPGAQVTAYVCERGHCERPTADPAELRRQLQH